MFVPGLWESERQTEVAVDKAEGCFGCADPELAKP